MYHYLKRILHSLPLLFWGSAIWAQCDCEEIDVRFRGYNCAGNGGFTISLNGSNANGSGDNCGAYFGTTWAQTKLALNTPYTVTSTNSCTHHVDLDIPACYDLYINGSKTNSRSLNDSGSGEGDKSWEIELRMKTPRSGTPGGSGGAPTGGSFRWEVSMGTLSDGSSAGNLYIYGEQMDAQYYKPASLQLSPDANLLSIIYQPDGTTFRQLISEEVIVDVIELSTKAYEIRFYDLSQIAGHLGQIAQVTGNPKVIWRLDNPDTSDATENQLHITEIRDSQETIHRIIGDSTNNEISIYEYNDLYGASFTEELDTLTGNTIKTEKRLDGSGNVIWKTIRHYHNFPWDEEIVLEIVDPDGDNLITSYTYYEGDSTAGAYGQLETVSYPDGSWVKYAYNSSGRITHTFKPWLDSPLNAEDATVNNCQLTVNQYNNDGLFATILSATEEKILGKTVARVQYDKTQTTIDGEPVEITVTSRYLNAETPIVSTKKHYLSTASDHLSNKPLQTVSSNNIVWNYQYERGNWDATNNQFTVGAGDAIRTTKTQSTHLKPNGISGKTIREVHIHNKARHQVYLLKQVFDNLSFTTFSEIISEYDPYGHLLKRVENGRVTYEASYASNKLQSSIDAYGIETTYTYNSAGQVATETKLGVPGEPDIITSFQYDEHGRTTQKVRTAGTLSESESNEYFGDGRVKAYTDALGRTTTYTYSNGGRTETRTGPGNLTIISDRYKDGQLKSITGTGTVAEYYQYNIDPQGFRTKLVHRGTSDSPRWTSQTANWLNKPVRDEKPAFDGTNLSTQYEYNSSGQLIKKSNATQAPTLYTYDALGALSMTGLDVDLNGILEPASVDRIAFSEYYFVTSGSTVRELNRSYVYRNNGNAVPTLLYENSKQLTNLPPNISASQTSFDAHGVQVVTEREIDRNTKSYTDRIYSSEIGRSIQQVYVNGLLRSANTPTVFKPTSFDYDALGRQTTVVSPFNGTTNYQYNHQGLLESVINADGIVEKSFQYYPATHINAGLISQTRDANNNSTFHEYNSRGQLIRQWGLNTYPIQYTYDAYGQQETMRTFRTEDTSVNWSTSVWPTNSGAGDTTRWIYQAATGLLSRKEYPDGNGTNYTYNLAGRIQSRTWARGITTDYNYSPITGDLLNIDYSDNTPDVSYTYDRQGKQASITDGSGTRYLEHTNSGALLSESYATGELNGYQMKLGYDQFGRHSQLSLSDLNNNIIVQNELSYDASSRIVNIRDGILNISHAYHAAGDRLIQRNYQVNDSKTYQQDSRFDSRGRLSSITATAASGEVLSHHAYTYDALNRRSQAIRENNDYWTFTYNERSEVTAANRQLNNNSLQAGLQFQYNYDTIGNRITASTGGDSTGNNLRSQTYTSNALSQYSKITTPAYLQITGEANPAASVSVNTQATNRQNSHFHTELSLDNSVGPRYQTIDVVATRTGHTPMQQTGKRYLAAAIVNPSYDLDGNLIQDARWLYTWNGENRLIAIQPHAAALLAGTPRQKLEFAYDSQGRRYRKTVFTWNPDSELWTESARFLYIYNQWNLIAEFKSTQTAPTILHKSYLWGNDISGSQQGAGGIAGLLAVTDSTSSTSYPYYDGNGNIMGYFNPDTGDRVAEYEYGPFGELIKKVGSQKDDFNFRFSSKYQDNETELIYYGFRYYDPETGRWPNRDPIEEEGGLNLYGFVLNSPVNYWDVLGLALPQAGYRPIRGQDWLGVFAPFWHAFVRLPDGRTTSNRGGEGGYSSDHTRYVDGVKVTDSDKSLRDGTPCECATDEQISECVWDYPWASCSAGFPFSNNCGSNVRDAFTSCCLEDPTPWWLFYPGGEDGEGGDGLDKE